MTTNRSATASDEFVGGSDSWVKAADIQINYAGQAAADGRFLQRDTHIARAQTYAQIAIVSAIQELTAQLKEVYHAIAEGK